MKKVIVSIIVIALLLGAVPLNIIGKEVTDEQMSHDPIIESDFKTPNKFEFVPGELIIKFREETAPHMTLSVDGIVNTGISSVNELIRKFLISSFEKLFKNNVIFSLSKIFKFNLPDNSDILSIIEEFNLDPNIEYAEPNYIYHTCAVPNDEYFDGQWSLNQISDCDIDAPEAWNIETGDSDIVIAIPDTGVDYNHPDLEGNIWINNDEIPDNGIDDDGNGFIDDIRGWDFFNDDNDPIDDYGHGTQCSGIASAVTNNSIGIAGVCWNCKIMTLKFLNSDGEGSPADAASAITYAVDNGADVISMSWGSTGKSTALEDALDYAYSKGVVLVAAAGNDNGNSKFYPAGYDNVIAVAATDSDDEKTGFSNYGSWIDVAAPGIGIFSTRLSENYGYMSGTSASCPHVTGLVGLILSKNPSFTEEEVRTIIHSTTDDVNSDDYIGIGRINAYKAIMIDSTTVAKLGSSLDDAVGQETIYISGTANGTDFLNYTLFYGFGVYPSSWTKISNSSVPVDDNLLGTWNTTLVSEGLFTIKLIVTAIDSGTREDRVIVNVDNAVISSPRENEIFEHGPIEISGRAAGINFQYYDVEYANVNDPEVWYLINHSTDEVIDNILAVWNITDFSNGEYILKLSVNNTHFVSTDIVNIFIDKTRPDPPTMTGPTNGIVGEEYEYTFNATDLDGDSVKYFINWSDGDTEWTEYYPSDSDVKVKHTWSKSGIYTLKAKAKDIYGFESDWGDNINVEITGKTIFQVSIKRGLGRSVKVDIISKGEARIHNIAWNLTVTKRMLGKPILQKNGIISELRSDKIVTVEGSPFGIGLISVEVNVTVPGLDTIHETAKGFIFLRFVRLRRIF
jgi:subtilisin family serine protease